MSSGLSATAAHSARAAARRLPRSSIGSFSASIRAFTSSRAVTCDTLGQRPNPSHMTARNEVKTLVDALKLPIDERGKRRAAARAEWIVAATKPLDTHGLLAD